MKTVRLFIFLSVVALWGCRSDEPFKKVVFADSPEMFNFVTTEGKTEPFITEGVTYNLVFDDDKKTATLTINNLKTRRSDPGLIVTFSDVEWTYVAGSHEKQRAVTATTLTSDNPGTDITLTDVVIIYSESNELNNAPAAGFYASYTVNGNGSILSYPYQVYADGTTTVRDDSDIMPQLVDYEPVYILDLHPSGMNLDIAVHGVEIAGKRLDFRLTGVAMTLTDVGYGFRIAQPVEVETSDGARVTVSELSGSANLRDELDLTMGVVYVGEQYVIEAYLAPDYNKIRGEVAR